MDVDFVTSAMIEQESLDFDENNNNNDNSNIEGERCGICMDIIIDRGVLDCCQHWFCFGCIDNWASITNLCPLCQNEFQLITCVPVYDTIGNNKVDEEQFSRDDDWSIEGKSNNLSFPSYYIDENAVICLDGDGCKIRSGLATVEEDSDLDTSIACDSCDIWYHAFCVGFNPEGTSEDTWLCPRCTVGDVPQKSDVCSIQKENNHCDMQSSCTSTLTSSSFSGKLSVSIADVGETAIVISRVRENEWIKEPSENIHQSLEIDKTMNVDAVNSDGSDLNADISSAENNDIQPILEAQGLELSLSRDTSFNKSQPSNSLMLSELNNSCFVETRNEPSNFDGVKDSLRKFNVGNKESDCESSIGLHLGLSVGCSWSVDHMKNIKIEDQVISDAQQQSFLDKSLLRDENILPDGNEETVKIIGMKRRHKDFSDDGKANAKNGDANLSKKTRAEGKFKITPVKDQGNAVIPGGSQNCATQKSVMKDAKQSSEKEDIASDLMSIVQGTGRRSAKGPAKEKENVAGLRVKKIMKRASEDKDSSIVVQELRKEIREAVRNKSSTQVGENLFDPKLLDAFRAAVAGTTTEPSQKLSPSAIKAKKTMMQKGKIRENLTKKIYGDPNGRRRRAWDRDCEIEFWKYRCTRATKPEKIATLKSVLNLLREDPSADDSEVGKAPKFQAKNPILSRLYLADTSVFPRKDDIKPLSALTPTSSSEQKSSQNTSMNDGQKTSPEDRTLAEANKIAAKPSIPSVHDKGLQNKLPISKGKAASNKASSRKETGGVQSDDRKIDKRKWALEVLARKKAAEGKPAHEQQEDNATLEGNFPLLAQLPIDMRPVLAASRHNKIPVSVRQTQLYRLTEHFLKKADLAEIRRTAETELAVADAINIEKEVADKSDSKVVYLNLCSQEIRRRSNNSKSSSGMESNSSPLSVTPEDRPEQSHDELPTDPAVLDALRNAGLLSDSPPSSPHHKMEVPGEQVNDEGPDNVFDIDSHSEVDIYGDFEYDLEDEDFIGSTAVKVSKVPPPEEGESRMKVVFSTLKSNRSDDLQEFEDRGKLENVEDLKDTLSLRNHMDTGMTSSNMEQETDKFGTETESSHGEDVEELSLAECEELYGPDKEPLISKFPEASSGNLCGLVDTETHSANEVPGGYENCTPSKSENVIAAPLGQNSCNEENSPHYSQTSEKIHMKDKSNTDNKRQSATVNSVSKKVETYIKEHIRPLCKSGIITPEQYRWAVAKTTEKVMKYHSKDKNANFLIKEGEKVKKLAQQYVEAVQQKEKGDPL